MVIMLLWLAAISAPLPALDPSKALASYQRQNWQTESGLPQNTVHAIVQTHDGYLWLATEGGLVRFDGLKFTVYDSQNTPALHSNNIRALLEDRERALWIGTADGLTVLRANGETAAFTREQGLPSNSVWSMEQDAAGVLRVQTAGGVAELRAGRFAAGPGRETVENGATGAMLRDKYGALWTGNHGLARTFNGRTETFSVNDPLASDVILSLFEDREGDLWIGTEASGVTVLRDQKITTYTTKDGMSDDLIRCVYQDREGALWFGTNSGLTKFAGGPVLRLTADDGLSSNVVFALGETGAGDLLVGTQDGLNVIHDGRIIKTLTTSDGLADDLVRSLHTDADGAVWIGTRRGLTLWKDGRFHTYSEADGLGSDLVGALTRDREGTLWVGTLRGLSQMKGGRFQTLTGRDGLASPVVTALYNDAAGALWIGTQDGGLHRMENGKIFHYPTSLGLPASVFAILGDAKFLWLTSKSGVYRVAKSELATAAEGHSVSWTVAQYGTADGMRVNECSEGGHPAAWRSRDGTLWFATLRGVSSMDAKTASAIGLAPQVAIESVLVDDQKANLKSNNEIPPGHARLAFEYTGITFVSPQRVHFRYMLEGFDHKWVDAGTRRTAYYTSLSPGPYRFRVTARTNDGDWTRTEGTVTFRLLPLFYQTVWFYLLLMLALGLSIYAFYRWRVRQVEAQFNLVLAERNRIAREIHDTLAQGFVAVSLQIELLARKLADAPEDVRNLVTQMREMVQSGLEEARRSIWELRSQGSEAGDFRARLSRMAGDIAKRAGLQVEFSVLGTYRALPEKIEDELLKIGQEAVTNAVRHAQAKRVRIDLAYQEKKLHMSIADDGRGFDAGPNAVGPEGHYGLRGMRERAAEIGAQITVNSRRGEGTQVDVEKIVP